MPARPAGALGAMSSAVLARRGPQTARQVLNPGRIPLPLHPAGRPPTTPASLGHHFHPLAAGFRVVFRPPQTPFNPSKQRHYRAKTARKHTSRALLQHLMRPMTSPRPCCREKQGIHPSNSGNPPRRSQTAPAIQRNRHLLPLDPGRGARYTSISGEVTYYSPAPPKAVARPNPRGRQCGNS